MSFLSQGQKFKNLKTLFKDINVEAKKKILIHGYHGASHADLNTNLSCYLAETGVYDVYMIVFAHRKEYINTLKKCGAKPILYYSQESKEEKKYHLSSNISEWVLGESLIENDFNLRQNWHQNLKSQKFDMVISDQENYFPIVADYLGVAHYIRISSGPYDAELLMDYGHQKCHSTCHVIQETRLLSKERMLDQYSLTQRYQNLKAMYQWRYKLDNLFRLRVEEILIEQANFNYYQNQKMPDLIISAIQGVQPLTPATGQFKFLYPSHKIRNGTRYSKQPPQQLQNFMNNHGKIIVISFGTFAVPEENKLRQINQFIIERTDYAFVIRYYGAQDNNALRNPRVRVFQELPQKFLLSHPNVKAFITHGGWGSVTESIQNLKPMIVIPIQFDQFLNCKHVHLNNLGSCINAQEIQVDLEIAIEKIERGDHEQSLQMLSNVIMYEMKHSETIFDAVNELFQTSSGDSTHTLPIYRKMNTIQYFELDIFASIFLLIVIFLLFILELLKRCLK
ncbi:antennal-enriched udp-glycosyltransferase [Stylonychia lemnae]|uniref:Antennal-enriched udp-glycosyltransferase n=1 Tax=Stylonychia lemnae TaxID=5949 RepID=A0A078B1D7_STYLE|nr:antennal-enriched udp-glycosyltransferase [Stylonychia lemnae]|eukprot:CDW87008.1 antennal-enriched udp-glycosyltransferase [Stylonychia lemnae]